MLLTAFSNLVLSPRTPKVPGFALPTVRARRPPLPPRPRRRRKSRRCRAARQGRRQEGRKQDAKVCETCHNFQEGEGPKIGPDLWGVVGRKIASVPGFAYSDSLKGVSGDWSYEVLNKWITDPKSDGLRDEDDVPRRKKPT